MERYWIKISTTNQISTETMETQRYENWVKWKRHETYASYMPYTSTVLFKWATVASTAIQTCLIRSPPVTWQWDSWRPNSSGKIFPFNFHILSIRLHLFLLLLSLLLLPPPHDLCLNSALLQYWSSHHDVIVLRMKSNSLVSGVI